MATVRKTIVVTCQQDAWIKSQIANGEYTNDSEYIRDLIRQDQTENARFRALKSAVQNQMHDDIGSRTVAEIWEEAEQYRHTASGTTQSLDDKSDAISNKRGEQR